MANCPSCNYKLRIIKSLLLFSIKKTVVCSNCGTNLALDQTKMMWFLSAFYGVGFLMGTYMYRNDFSSYSILLFVSTVFIAAALFSRRIKLKLV